MLYFLLVGAAIAQDLCLNDFVGETRDSAQLYSTNTGLKRQISKMSNCLNMKKMDSAPLPPNVVQIAYAGRVYMMEVADVTDAHSAVQEFFRGKFPEHFDDDHQIALTFMMDGRKYWIEDDYDFETFLKLPPNMRDNALTGMIGNTAMPTSAPTTSSQPTMSPTMQPTSLMCQSVFGWGGDGHGLYTLYRNQVTLHGGHNNYRQGATIRQPSQPIYVQLSHGHWNAAAVKMDGKITVWGNRNQFYNKNPANGEFVWIQSGNDFGCAMNMDGTLNCFGNTGGSWGVNGGVTDARNIPLKDDIIAYQCGGYFCCLVDSEGKMTCWGRHNEGQLNVPENDDEKNTYVDVACGHHFAVGVKQDRTPRCWGQDNGGPISQCPKTEKFRFISCGGYHCCGIRYDYDEEEKKSGEKDWDARCWGYNGHREVSNLPKRQGNDGIKVRALLTNHHGSCALRYIEGENDFQPICWGLDNGNYFPHGGDKNTFYTKRFPCELDSVANMDF